MLGLLGVDAHHGLGLLDGLHGAGAGHAAAGARHALQQVAGVLALHRVGDHLAALPQALGLGHLDLPVGIALLDHVHHRLGHAAGHGEVAPVSGGVVDAVGILRQALQLDVLGVEDAGHLLKGEDEVHLAAHALAHGLQLLGGAGADEHDLAVGVVVLDEPGGEGHGGEGHGDAVGVVGEGLLGHDRPGRAAGGAHEGDLLRHLPDEVLRLLGGAQVGADGHLEDIGEAQGLHGGAELAGGDLGAELAHEGGGHGGVYPLAGLDGPDDLENLGLVGDGAEGAVHQAHAAGDALLRVDIRLAVGVGADGVHAAGHGAGPLLDDDGLVGAHVGAPAALDALVLVDVGAAVVPIQLDGVLGAHLLTGVGQAALAALGDQHLLLRAAVAGELDHVDQRRGVVGLRPVGGLNIVGEGGVLRRAAAGQAHGQAQPLAHDGPLQKHVVAEVAHLAGNDLVGERLDALVHRPLGVVGHAGHLAEDPVANLLNTGFYASHCRSPP